MGIAWFWLAVAVVCSSGGNVLMKCASRQGDDILQSVFSVDFFLGAAVFAFGLVCYMRALTRLPLAIAYPVLVGASMIGSIGMATWLFGESLSLWHVGGVLLIFGGLLLLAMPHPRAPMPEPKPRPITPAPQAESRRQATP